MKRWNLKLYHKLGIAAFFLGFVALFAGDPYFGGHIEMDGKELALVVENEADRIRPEALADWIIQGRADYRLIDIRPEKEFGAYHIPTAENVPVATLTDYPITRNEKILVYSENGVKASQAWMLLRAGGFKSVYMLVDGMEGWKREVLFPKIPADSDPNQELFAKKKEVSKFFGGKPQTAADDEEPGLSLETPSIQPPANIVLPVKKKGSSEEGC